MTILITGGSKGIGRGIAERFAAEGSHVLINYSSDEAAALETANAVNSLGGRATLIRADLSDEEGVQILVEKTRQRTEVLDQIVYGAVWPHTAGVMQIDLDDFQRAIWINATAMLALVQQLRPLLKSGSSIFYLSSRGSKIAVPNYLAVGAPKALAEALVRYLAVDLAPSGIRVNTVSPSGVLTDAVRQIRPNADEWDAEMTKRNPSGRTVKPADVGHFIYHLASPELSMVTGREFAIDGGLYVSGE